ncbi:Os06g0536200, partial [Oryza sativa Japonica Group]
ARLPAATIAHSCVTSSPLRTRWRRRRRLSPPAFCRPQPPTERRLPSAPAGRSPVPHADLVESSSGSSKRSAWIPVGCSQGSARLLGCLIFFFRGDLAV